MVACSPAISHWLLTDLFLATGYKALANTAFDLFCGSHAIKQTKLVPRLPVLRCLRP